MRREEQTMPVTVTPEAVEQTVVETIASFGPEPEQVTREATFESIEVDSLDLVELAQVVEEEFGVALKSDDVKDIRTVGELIDLVVSRAS
jgi:acyl carrier protein